MPAHLNELTCWRKCVNVSRTCYRCIMCYLRFSYFLLSVTCYHASPLVGGTATITEPLTLIVVNIFLETQKYMLIHPAITHCICHVFLLPSDIRSQSVSNNDFDLDNPECSGFKTKMIKKMACRINTGSGGVCCHNARGRVRNRKSNPDGVAGGIWRTVRTSPSALWQQTPTDRS